MNLDEFRAQVKEAQDRVRHYQDGNPRSDGAFSGRVVADLGVLSEELRVADEELRAQNEELLATRQQIESERVRYKALFDLCPGAYLVTSAEGSISEANLAAAQMLATEPHNLIGKPLIVFVPEVDRRTFRNQLDAILNATDPIRFEMSVIPRVVKKPIPVRVTAQASGAGSSALVRWLLVDISELYKLSCTVKTLDEDMWMRVGERTAEISTENERLKRELQECQRDLTLARNSRQPR